jgi:hypothetical protein
MVDVEADGRIPGPYSMVSFGAVSGLSREETNLGSLYKGLVRDTKQSFKHLRRAKHTHHPVDDARGNAEALLHMRDAMGLKIDLR